MSMGAVVKAKVDEGRIIATMARIMRVYMAQAFG